MTSGVALLLTFVKYDTQAMGVKTCYSEIAIHAELNLV